MLGRKNKVLACLQRSFDHLTYNILQSYINVKMGIMDDPTTCTCTCISYIFFDVLDVINYTV